jgi:long-subunit acyl-CoA synthetase (AMP-forming)
VLRRGAGRAACSQALAATTPAPSHSKTLILADEWTVAGEELTPTLKIRRTTIEKKYAKTIRSMYA